VRRCCEMEMEVGGLHCETLSVAWVVCMRRWCADEDGASDVHRSRGSSEWGMPKSGRG